MNIVKDIEKSIENADSRNIMNDLIILEKSIKSGKPIGRIADRLKSYNNSKVNKFMRKHHSIFAEEIPMV